RNERAAVFRDAERFGNVVRNRLDLHAEPTAAHLTVLLQLIDDARDRIGGNREADADRSARRRNDRRIHADDFTVHIEQRPARIALIDRRIRLQVIIVGTGVDIAALRRDDAERYRSAEPEWIADRHDPVADFDIGGRTELHIGERLLRRDLEQR